jgi:hypothetical protein
MAHLFPLFLPVGTLVGQAGGQTGDRRDVRCFLGELTNQRGKSRLTTNYHNFPCTGPSSFPPALQPLVLPAVYKIAHRILPHLPRIVRLDQLRNPRLQFVIEDPRAAAQFAPLDRAGLGR